MTTAVRQFLDIVNLACGAVRPGLGSAERRQLIFASLLGTVVLSAVWGLAAGSVSPQLAASNAFTVPLVVIIASLCALPAGALALKLSGAAVPPRDLVLAYASAVFGGSLVLAVSAPLVAVYYHTSQFAGQSIAIGSAMVAIAVAVLSMIRNLVRLAPSGSARWPLVITAVVFLTIYLAALVQLVSLASPILPDHSVFDGGVDEILGH